MATAQARNHNNTGLSFYESWQLEKAIAAFSDAVSADSKNPEYRLNLVRAYARNGNYDQAMQALGEYLQTETKQDVADRFERLFSSALDDVEEKMIETMKEMGLSMQQIGKGIQMWLEYRITIGRRPLRIIKPELWSAALIYAICKINFIEIKRQQIIDKLNINPKSFAQKYDELVETLDIMPADYRYFTGEKNPLDKLIEAAQLLENLDEQFREE
ncbi:MAG: tetratricopeptide repeat protein [Chloroflexi bacterium]|nr:tetratricopeptide repeat protein [Chloroflexota bacterium]